MMRYFWIKHIGSLTVIALTIAVVILYSLPKNTPKPVESLQEEEYKPPEYVKYKIRYERIYEFKLTDGTSCVVVNSNGITCNWKSN